MLATQSPQGSPARTPADPAPVDVTPLFPRGVYEDIDNCAEVIAAQDDLEQRRRAGAPTGACVIIEDEQLQDQACVELSGPGASLNFRSRSCVQPYIVLYVKVSTKFFALRLNVIDRNEKYYTFNLSNRRSIVKVDGCTCDLPLVVGEGWQYVAVPLAELTRRCFGADYARASRCACTRPAASSSTPRRARTRTSSCRLPSDCSWPTTTRPRSTTRE